MADQQGIPSDNVFGFDTFAPDGTDPLSDNFGAEAPTETPASTEEPPAVAEEETPAPETPETPEAPPSETPETPPETPEQPAAEEIPEKVWANKYKSAEELERAHEHLQRRLTQAAQERAAAVTQNEQLTALVQQITPALQRMAQGQTPEVTPETFDPSDPQQFQAVLEQTVQQRLQAAQEQIHAQARQELLVQQIDGAVRQFRTTHPDVAPGSDIDTEIGEVVKEFQKNTQTGKRDYNLFPLTSENLELAYKYVKNPSVYETLVDLDLVPDDPENYEVAELAAQNPAFRRVIKANPIYLDSPEGIEVAKEQAGITPNKVVAPSPGDAARRTAAHVETGSGAPAGGAPGQRPKGDEFDEAIAWWKTGESNVFGIQS